MYFLLGALSEADGGQTLSTVVIGIGNSYRRDDGVGLSVAAAIDERALPGVRVLAGIEDPLNLVDAWTDATFALLVDAAVVSTSASKPGRVHRCTMSEVVGAHRLSSHGLDIAEALSLGEALGRMPDRLVLFTVETADVSQGAGLTPAVAAAVPEVVAAAMAEITGSKAT